MKYKIFLFGFQILMLLSDRLAAHWAAIIWSGTRRYPEPAREQQWRQNAKIGSLNFQLNKQQTVQIRTYYWAQKHQKKPLILLIHGWNGRGLQLAGFVQALLSQGYHVLSFDAPGHGNSSGNKTDLNQVANLVHHLAREQGPFDTIIAHSFGALVMAKVLQDGLNIRKAVSISAPISSVYLFDMFCDFIKISVTGKKLLMNIIRSPLGENFFNLDITLENLKQLKVAAVIVHDKHDREIPVSHAIKINSLWSGSKLILTEKMGHLRILQNESLINSIVSFIKSK